MLSLSLVLGLCMPGPDAWAARGARAARSGSAAGKKAKVRKGTPQLIAPEEDAELKPGSVTLTWRVAAKLVRLQVARDGEFTDTVVDRPVKTLYAVVQLEPGTYYWRVTGPKRMASDPRRLVVAEPEPQAQPLAQAQPEAQPLAQAQPETQAQPEAQSMAGGLGLDLTGSTTPGGSEAAAQPLAAQSPVAAAEVPSGPTEPTGSVVAEAERSSSAQRGASKRWNLLVGGSAAYGPGSPGSMATLRYEGSVAVRIVNPLELSLSVGGTSLRVLGTRDASWPLYQWLGQVYFDLSGRYRLARFESSALYALVGGRLSFFTATKEQQGFLVDRSPFSPGAGLGFRFRAGMPMELGLRGNLLTGAKLGAELELGLRVLVF